MGWQAPKSRGAFDVLPLLIETRDEGQLLFTLPRKVVKEVPLRHPEFDWFAELGLRWHAVPAISNMRLCIGGISYPAAPFNGWYMGTEIGARNLTDADRYDLLGVVADRLGLDRSDERTLWRDRAAVEINRAVLHSYAEDGVTITDHHTESHRFLAHVAKEGRAGAAAPPTGAGSSRPCPAASPRSSTATTTTPRPPGPSSSSTRSPSSAVSTAGRGASRNRSARAGTPRRCSSRAARQAEPAAGRHRAAPDDDPAVSSGALRRGAASRSGRGAGRSDRQGRPGR